MDSRNCDKYNTKTKEYKKISYTRSGKRVSYCRSSKKKMVSKSPPCKQYGDDYEEIKRRNKRGTTTYCRKRNNIAELREQITKLKFLERQLISELSKRIENKENDITIKKLKKTLLEVSNEKEELKERLINERKEENEKLGVELNEVKTQLGSCNMDKQSIIKQFQNLEKEKGTLERVKLALQTQIKTLENKFNTEEKRLLQEKKTCELDKHNCLVKLQVIETEKGKLQELEGKEKAQTEKKFEQLVESENNLREQLRIQQEKCDNKVNELTSKLAKYDEDITKYKNRIMELEEKLEQTKLIEEETKRQLEDCNQRNLLLTEDLHKSKEEVAELKRMLETVNSKYKSSEKLKHANRTLLVSSENKIKKIETESKNIKQNYEECKIKLQQFEAMKEEYERRNLEIKPTNENEIKKLQTEMKNLSGNYDKLNELYKALNNEYDKLLERYKNKEIECNETKEQKIKIQQQLEELTIQNKTMTEELKKRDQLIDKLQQDLKTQQESYESKIKKLELKFISEPAVAIVENKGDIIGVVNQQGEIKALEEPIEIGDIPPPPPGEAPILSVIPKLEFKSKKDKEKVVSDIQKGKIGTAPQSLLTEIEKGFKLKKVEKCNVGWIWDGKKCIKKEKQSLISGSLQESLQEKLAERREQLEKEEENEDWNE